MKPAALLFLLTLPAFAADAPAPAPPPSPPDAAFVLIPAEEVAAVRQALDAMQGAIRRLEKENDKLRARYVCT